MIQKKEKKFTVFSRVRIARIIYLWKKKKKWGINIRKSFWPACFLKTQSADGKPTLLEYFILNSNGIFCDSFAV